MKALKEFLIATAIAGACLSASAASATYMAEMKKVDAALKSGATIVWDKEVQDAAILWSQKKGDRSGRIAYQFASNWVGQNLLEGNKSDL